jgi:hypothetical protein
LWDRVRGMVFNATFNNINNILVILSLENRVQWSTEAYDQRVRMPFEDWTK